MTEPADTNATPSPDALETRLATLATDLDVLESKLSRDAKLTLAVGLVVLTLFTGGFLYGYAQLDELLRPQTLVDASVNVLDQNIEPARQSLEAEIERQAPVIAEVISEQAIASVPDLRERLEDYLLEQMDQAVDQAAGDSEVRFAAILEQNRPEVQSLITDLKNDQEVSDEMMTMLETAINEQIGQDMQANAERMLHTLFALSYQAERLREGRGLNKEEQLMRRTLMILRRLQSGETADSATDLEESDR